VQTSAEMILKDLLIAALLVEMAIAISIVVRAVRLLIESWKDKD
jgi:hypothetical protein